MIAAKILLLAHAVAGLVLAGSSIHHGVLCVRSLLRRPPRPRLRRLYATVTFWSMLVVVGVGLWIYPTFRVDVRAAWLDTQVPLATGMFEIKEHWAALGLGAAGLLFGLRDRTPDPAGGPDLRALDRLGIVVGLLVSVTVLIGLTLVSLRSI